MKTALDSANEIIVKRDTVVETTSAKLNAAQAEHDAAVTEKKQAEQEMEKIRMKILEMKGLTPQPDDG